MVYRFGEITAGVCFMAPRIEIKDSDQVKVYSCRSGVGFQALAVREDTGIEFDCRKADCGVCLIAVSEGMQNLSAPSEKEADYLKAIGAQPKERLACQANIYGDVSVSLSFPEQKTLQGVSLSEAAVRQIPVLQAANPDFREKDLRLYLDGKGCDGFYYGVTFDDSQPADMHFPTSGGVDLVVDSQTLQFTDGSHIDWIDDDRGRGFLVENPNQHYFRGKFYKQNYWRRRLEVTE